MQESIHQAATIILLRERTENGQPRLEVYMTKRPDSMRFLPSHYVFPGGQMDEGDSDPRWLDRCATIPPALNPENLSLAYWVTAIRETFEEVGILFAYDPHGHFVHQDSFDNHRQALLNKETTFFDMIERTNSTLAIDKLRYFGHRLTPRHVSSKRFDTRYFLTLLPLHMEPSPHPGEIAEAEWLNPKTALAKWEMGQMFMVPPTVDSLRVSGRFSTADAIWNSTEGVGRPTREELA